MSGEQPRSDDPNPARPLDAAGGDGDRRQGQRFVSVLRVARLTVAGREELCLIRNISAGGLMAQIYSARQTGERATIELKSGYSVDGRVVWIKEPQMGFAFDAPIDVAHALAVPGDDGEGHRPRMPRIPAVGPVRVRTVGRLLPGEMCDLSQGGAKVRLRGEAPQEGPAALLVGEQEFAGRIRWHEGEHLGIGFDRPLTLACIAQIVARLAH